MRIQDFLDGLIYCLSLIYIILTACISYGNIRYDDRDILIVRLYRISALQGCGLCLLSMHVCWANYGYWEDAKRSVCRYLKAGKV